MRTTNRFPIIAVIFLAACGGGSVEPIEGPLNLDIVAGQDQIAKAGTPQLSDPVVGQLVRVRTADGRWRFRFELVKTAYAQNTVNGSPVVGAVVCSETVSGNFKPFSVCTNTDSNGKATFFYETGTKAGAQRAEIRGLNAQGQPAVFDTVRAVVEPGPVDPNLAVRGGCSADLPRVAADSLVRDVYRNTIPFRVLGDSVVSVAADGRTLTPTRTPKAGEAPLTGVLRVNDAAGTHVADLFYKRTYNPLFGIMVYAKGKVPSNPDIC